MGVVAASKDRPGARGIILFAGAYEAAPLQPVEGVVGLEVGRAVAQKHAEELTAREPPRIVLALHVVGEGDILPTAKRYVVVHSVVHLPARLRLAREARLLEQVGVYALGVLRARAPSAQAGKQAPAIANR